MKLTEYIYESNRSINNEQLANTFTKFINNFGIDSFVLAEMTGNSTSKKEDGFGIMVNYPEEWLKHYFENHYIEHDPVYRMALTAKVPFTWEELMKSKNSEKQKKVMNEAKEFGLCCGIGIPVIQSAGRVVGFGLSSSEKEIICDKDTLSILQTAAFQSLMVHENFLETEISNNLINITSREREVLLWIANGKTKSEVAKKLTVSESCIKRHCENIFRKLQVNNLPHAVAKALSMGLINPF